MGRPKKAIKAQYRQRFTVLYNQDQARVIRRLMKLNKADYASWAREVTMAAARAELAELEEGP